MAEQFPELDDTHMDFIRRQHVFFVGTAGATGRVNLSPKGQDTLRIIDQHTIAWLNLTGSGNETAAHVLDHPRMTLMFCSFERRPLILRVYGRARVLHPRDARWLEHLALFPVLPGARQIFVQAIELVQTSCGFAVPRFEFSGERDSLDVWASNKGPDGIREYWAQRNRISLDGKPTRILDDN